MKAVRFKWILLSGQKLTLHGEGYAKKNPPKKVVIFWQLSFFLMKIHNEIQ